MLYVTTRNNRDAYTAHRAMAECRGPDGGLYVPFREPRFTPEEIRAFSEKTFNTAVAEILNRLAGTKLTGWDVDLAIGRYAVRMEKLGQRVMVAECFHNLEADFSGIVRILSDQLAASAQLAPGCWSEIAVRIAVLFGIFGELMRRELAGEDNPVDIAVVSGDFAAPISAWYARQWGLPIGNIVCACNDNGQLWDFICHGQFKSGELAVCTNTPEADVVVPVHMERLIYGCAGAAEVARYLEAVRRGSNYYVSDALLQKIRQGIYVTVSSQRRVKETVSRVYGSYGHILSPYTALSFAGLQDYRARTGESRRALVLAEKSPLRDVLTVSDALGITEETLKTYLQ